MRSSLASVPVGPLVSGFYATDDCPGEVRYDLRSNVAAVVAACTAEAVHADRAVLLVSQGDDGKWHVRAHSTDDSFVFTCGEPEAELLCRAWLYPGEPPTAERLGDLL